MIVASIVIIKIVNTTKMLTEPPSDNTRVQPSGMKPIRLNKASLSNEASDKAIPPIGGKTSLEAAMATAITYVKTLHKKLQPFLTDLIRQVLKNASTYHYKSDKFKEIVATPEYVPAICHTVEMKLQAVSKITKSTGFKALEDKLEEAIEATRCNWARHFVFPVLDLNVKALRKRFQLSYCRLLSLAAKGFVTKVGTNETTPTLLSWTYLPCMETRWLPPSTSPPTTSSYYSRKQRG